jgi:hypothetical protein
MPDQVTEKPKPIMHSSVDAVKQAHDAKNAAQKADLMMEGAGAQKKLYERVAALERQLEGLRSRIEVLEAEDNVMIPYGDEKGL